MNRKILGGIGAGITVAIIIVVYILTFEPETEPFVSQTINEKLGLVINTPNVATSLQTLDEVYSQAALTGIGRSNVYMFWNIVEPEREQYNWEQTDVLMSFNKKNDLAVTLYFSVINGRQAGPFPDWIGSTFIGKNLEDDLVRTLDTVLSRYHIIDTVIIGGETDAYFRNNEVEISNYEELFNGVYKQIKEKHPQVKIGNAFSLHSILNKNLEHLVEKLDMGDFVAFTYFPVNFLNDIEKTPQEARADLEKIFELVPNKKVALFEISWSTSDFVGGNEQDQTGFLKTSYDFYREHESEFEFFTWYRQYDRPEGTCTPDPATVESTVSVGGGSGMGSSEFVIERLGEYTCNAGLLDVQGNQKQSWNEFTRQVQMSTNS